MRRLVDAPLVVGVAEASQDLEAEPALHGRFELAFEEGVVDVPGVRELGHQRRELFFQLVEDLADLGGLHLRLVVVEEQVVGLVRGLEAGHVAVPKLDQPLEMRAQLLEIGRLLRGSPRRERKGRGPPHLTDQLGRNTRGLFVLAPRDPDQARLERIVVRALLEWTQLLEQATDLPVDKALLR